MGRVKPTIVKRIATEIYGQHRERLGKTFEENRVILPELASYPNKKMRNVIAGYLTRLVRRGLN